MKKLTGISGIIFILIAFSNCEKEPNDTVKLSLVKTTPGGCNNQKSAYLMNPAGEQPDTVIFSVRKDTLDVFVGLNYICCAPFNTASTFRNDSIIINITDTCPAPYQSCYCKCMCYYTWDFLFADYQGQKYGYKVILKDPRQKDPILIKEGRINS
jgi:hypothetical protein